MSNSAARPDELVTRLVGVGFENDCAPVLLDRPAQLAPRVALEQVAVADQQRRIRCLGKRLLVQRLRGEEVTLVAADLVPLEEVLLVHPVLRSHAQ